MYPILAHSNLSWLDVSSPCITVNDQEFLKLLCALSTATNLVALSVAGWKFNLKVRKNTVFSASIS